MRSSKSIGLFTACGFILSFVAGLFSHSSFLSVLLKALVSAVVFGLLGFGIMAVYGKFLSDASSGDSQGDYTGDSSSAGSVTGQHVDITIEDEELKPSESENHFVVGDNHQMLNDSDVRNVGKVETSVADSSPGFVPLRNFETVTNFSGKESVIPSEAVAVEKDDSSQMALENKNAAFATSSTASSDEGIDTLPDMENFVFSDNTSSESESDEVDSGSQTEFSSTGSSKKMTARRKFKMLRLWQRQLLLFYQMKILYKRISICQLMTKKKKMIFGKNLRKQSRRL